MAHTTMDGRVGSPMPMAMGTAARSSISGTMETKKTARYFRIIFFTNHFAFHRNTAPL